jgi:hypothetical protein
MINMEAISEITINGIYSRVVIVKRDRHVTFWWCLRRKQKIKNRLLSFFI